MKQPKADGRTDMKCYLKGVFRIAVLLLTTFMVIQTMSVLKMMW